MYSSDFDSVLHTGDEEKDLKKIYSIMSVDENDEFIHIGNTKYYKVRKGPHHYRIVAGKKMTDAEFCWKVEGDPKKKQWFVNGLGTKKWHLPDIHQTEEERQKEIQILKEKKKREETEMLERRKAMKRGTEKFELTGPPGFDNDGNNAAPTAPFQVLKEQSESLEHKNKKKQGCPCVVQ